MSVTELVNINSIHIDEMSSLEIATLMVEEDKVIHDALQQALQQIADATDLLVEKWKVGGRVFVVGAGTSGRLGMLDSVELGPTFSIEASRWMAFVAGGDEAMCKPLENHEDDEEAVPTILDQKQFNKNDVLIGITASGSTPFVLAGLKYAKEKGGTTISISNNHHTKASKLSDCAIEVIVGPEVIKGSTRLKAGTAQKIVINILSTATMVRVGKVYQNQMVDMQLINKKLVKRAERILMEITHISEEEASSLLKDCDNNLKIAVFTSLTNAPISEASKYIDLQQGHLKQAIQKYFQDYPVDGEA